MTDRRQTRLAALLVLTALVGYAIAHGVDPRALEGILKALTPVVEETQPAPSAEPEQP